MRTEPRLKNASLHELCGSINYYLQTTANTLLIVRFIAGTKILAYMPLDTVIIVLGFVGLIWGADKFVLGASALAGNLGVSRLMVGG